MNGEQAQRKDQEDPAGALLCRCQYFRHRRFLRPRPPLVRPQAGGRGPKAPQSPPKPRAKPTTVAASSHFLGRRASCPPSLPPSLHVHLKP